MGTDIHPWGTLAFIRLSSDEVSMIYTLNFVFFKNVLNHSKSMASIPKANKTSGRMKIKEIFISGCKKCRSIVFLWLYVLYYFHSSELRTRELIKRIRLSKYLQLIANAHEFLEVIPKLEMSLFSKSATIIKILVNLPIMSEILCFENYVKVNAFICFFFVLNELYLTTLYLIVRNVQNTTALLLHSNSNNGDSLMRHTIGMLGFVLSIGISFRGNAAL